MPNPSLVVVVIVLIYVRGGAEPLQNLARNMKIY
jgi:hypothetical protein